MSNPLSYGACQILNFSPYYNGKGRGRAALSSGCLSHQNVSSHLVFEGDAKIPGITYTIRINNELTLFSFNQDVFVSMNPDVAVRRKDEVRAHIFSIFLKIESKKKVIFFSG